MALTGNEPVSVPGIAMEDDLGIIYLVETASQFWSELEDILNFGTKDIPTLSLLDSTLRRSLALCSAYHEQYLQSPLQLEHACELILDSELFEFHSERMSEILIADVQSGTDPHLELIIYHILLCYGRRRNDLFRSHKRFHPLLPLLMDHVLVEIDPDVEDTYFGVTSGSNRHLMNVPVPIEAKLRSVSVKLLYEVSRVQKLSVQDLKIFHDSFIDHLFDLVEQTRHMHDDSFNYSVIKLIVSLNEQFMVASLPPEGDPLPTEESKNRVLRVFMRRLGSSKTFGENMIFMLNRAGRNPEDLCMQLLILKILYLLFTTKGTSEYFYTNDLRVLVDVFLREIVDLDEDSESLRHTYLRVLHPLLTKTQLREVPYKRSQIVMALESLVTNSPVREVNPTTKRLVERCLGGDWCVNLLKARQGSSPSPPDTPSYHFPPSRSPTLLDNVPALTQLERSNSKKLKSSKSVEHLKVQHGSPKLPRSAAHAPRRTSNSSATSLPRLTSTTASSPTSAPPASKYKTFQPAPTTRDPISQKPELEPSSHQHQPSAPLRQEAPDKAQPVRRSAPPPPPPPLKRRKPPAVPVQRTLGGPSVATLKSSMAGLQLATMRTSNFRVTTPS